MRNIILWTTPRSHSTALAYSFGNRNDTVVVDEPLYASWLNASGAPHNGRELVLQGAKSLKQSELIDYTLSGALDKPTGKEGISVRFWKHIAKHYDPSADSDDSWLWRDDVQHVFLVRDPKRVLKSWSKVEPVTSEEIGFSTLVTMYERVKAHSGSKKPLLLDSKYLSLDPEGVLEELCNSCQIPFQKEMLRWEAGPRPFDIPNATFWYENVWKSTGFLPYRAEEPETFTGDLAGVATELESLYKKLETHKNAVKRKPKPVYVGIGKDVHDILPDGRNANLKVWVSDLGGIVDRENARVSVFDSSVQGGDHVWEGIRVYEGKIFALQYHIDRLMDSAKALNYAGIPSQEEIEHAIIETLKANGMRDGVHMRLTLTRGTKVSSSMNPLFNRSGCTLIVLAEWKDPVYSDEGIRLITSSIRRNTPAILDSKIHHGNMLHLILAKMQANFAQVDDAVMLDVDGFVAETNACNIFAVVRPVGYPSKRVLVTPLPDACLNGVTRQIVLELARAADSFLDLDVQERRVSLTELHAATEVFVTGSMGALTSVVEIDGRRIGTQSPNISLSERFPITAYLQDAYFDRWQNTGHILPF
mmetsp:Transcript_4358/g.5371  ORF Transcript_4358/g.5371 Transcript_4358/m.5371 type:complete len:589 (+) Transcript_4358:85-1851(+)